jgi:peptidoglycan hydrolase-like protein with peptidoglycan-binding domain
MSIPPVGQQEIQYQAGINETDPIVHDVQQALNQLGLAGAPNGVFNRETQQAIQRFQTANHISGNGEINQDTIDALNRQVQQRQSGGSPETTSSNRYSERAGGRLRQERRLEGDVRRNELQSHPGLTNGRTAEDNRRIMRGVQNGSTRVPQSQSGPLHPPAAQLPHQSYDYRNVRGGGLLERGPNATLENQHTENMQAANRYAGRYEGYVNEYIRRVNQAHSFAELQNVGSLRPPEQFNPGTQGSAGTVRQHQEMQGLRNQFNEINNRTASAQSRAWDAVANQARRLRGEEAHGPNLTIEVNPGDLIPHTQLSGQVRIDGDGARISGSAEREGRIGRNLRFQGGVDSNGEVTGEVSVRAPGVRLRAERSQNLNGEAETTLGARVGTRRMGIGFEAGSDSHVGFEVTHGGITAGTQVNPRAGSFNQSVELPLPGTEEGSIKFTFGFRGLSQEDAERIGRALASSQGFFDLPPEAIRAMDRQHGH